MEKILVIDDDNAIVEAISESLKPQGYDMISDIGGKGYRQLMGSGDISLVLLDVFMGEISGLDVLCDIRENYSDVNVIMISGESDIETAIRAIRMGAFDFLEKPISKNKLLVTVKNALSDRRQKQENSRLKENFLSKYAFHGSSDEIGRLEKTIEKAARSNLSVLITGENGTGKEIAAKRLHFLSARAAMPLVTINCASIPGELLESELFGHKKGSFTGAISDKDGVFLRASGGTIFLDEIGDMPFDLQAKILRVLQEQEVVRIGESKPTKIDVRVISATNRDLKQQISINRFREDLYYRLNGLELQISPLRERKEDIRDLVDHFVKELCFENNIEIPEIYQSAMTKLISHSFPGNVRELKNIVSRTIIMNDSSKITSFDLPQGDSKIDLTGECLGNLSDVKKRLMGQYLKKRLSRLDDDKKELARELGIHVNNLYRLIKENID